MLRQAASAFEELSTDQEARAARGRRMVLQLHTLATAHVTGLKETVSRCHELQQQFEVHESYYGLSPECGSKIRSRVSQGPKPVRSGEWWLVQCGDTLLLRPSRFGHKMRR